MDSQPDPQDDSTAALVSSLREMERDAAALSAEIAHEIRADFADMLDGMTPVERELAPRVLPVSMLPDVHRDSTALRLVSLTRQRDRLRREGQALREMSAALTVRSKAARAATLDARYRARLVRERLALAGAFTAHGRDTTAWSSRVVEHQRRAAGGQK